MANAHLHSTAVHLPNETIIEAPQMEQLDDVKDASAVGEHSVEVEAQHGDAMPEGPTTGKYEEWAYVSAMLSVSVIAQV
jgi:hypothetical protein